MVQLIHKGYEFAQVGRALTQNPDFAIKTDEKEPLCDKCNRCVSAMDAGGVYCVSKAKGYL